MKLNLTKVEQQIINKINKYTYYIKLNEENNDPSDLQEKNLSALLYNAQLLIDLCKAKGIEVGDSSDIIKEKLNK